VTSERLHPYELPRGWVWTSLGEIALEPQYGWTTSAAHTGRLRLLRTTDITHGPVHWTSVPFCKNEPADAEKYLLHDGDIVISRAGSVGYSYLIRKPPEAIFASYLIRFKPLIYESYFAAFLESPLYWQFIWERSIGIALANVNASKLKQIPIPLPPLPEQHRIVAKIEELFTRLDVGVEALKKVKAQLKRYRQAVLKHAFEGKLTAEWREAHKDQLEPASVLLERIKQDRQKTSKGKYKEPPPLDTSALPELPKGWVWTRLGEVGNIFAGYGFPKKLQGNTTGDLPFFKVADISSASSRGDVFLRCAMNYISIQVCNEIRATPLREGTVVFPKIGEAIKLNRRAILAQDSLVDNNVAGFLPSDCLNNLFAFYFFLTLKLEEHSRATTVPSVRKTDLEYIHFPLPPLPEQHRIVEEIERRFSVADQIEKIVDHSLKQAERLRQSILRRAFEGRLVPQDPNDEPAEKLLERIRQERARLQAERKPAKSRWNKPSTKQVRLV
jgi:type I restriction enzyme S subunit